MTDIVNSTTPSTKVTIDGVTVDAKPGELIIEAAERAGVFIPRFCYHPRMEPVGMCRMCLVEVSSPRGFSLQPACYLKVADGQEVKTTSEKARKAQEGVLEFLLVNHPLDCPVCDKGGECPLQDQALSYGPGESRFLEEKRHWEKPIALSSLVDLDRERCIQCARCTRFADEIAGEALIDFAYRGDEVEVSTFPDHAFNSYFSGNTVQICPVGALTAQPYRFKSRPWDLEQVESTCTTCSVGCRVVAQSSAGQLVRYLGIDVDPVNQSWLCDKGRFSFEAVHAPSRMTQPIIRRDGEEITSPWNEALGEVAAGIRWGFEHGGPDQIGVIGGARFTNEDAYAWAKLAKSVIKTDSVDAQLGDGLSAETVLGLPRATIDEAARARLIVLLGPDLREELPVLFLRLRKAFVTGGTKLIECSPVETSLSEHALVRLSYLPGEVARLAQALVDPTTGASLSGLEADDIKKARSTISEFGSGDGVVVVFGRASIAESQESIGAAIAQLRRALPNAKFLPALRRSNVHGALDMGLSPGILPGRISLDAGREHYLGRWGGLPESRGLDAKGILEAAASGDLTTLILLGADPLGDFPDRKLALDALKRVPFLVWIGTHPDASSALAHIQLPVAGDAERSGTTTNLEGRVTKVAQKVVPPGVSWQAWIIASEVARRLGVDLGFDTLESIQDEIAQMAPSHRGITAELLAHNSFRDGIVVPLRAVDVSINSRAPQSRPIDPIATPGISSVETQGAPMSVGDTGDFHTEAAVENGSVTTGDLGNFGGHAGDDVPVAPRLDAYSLRLVVRRSLYDGGTLTRASASLAPLAPKPTARVHPHELARLGVSKGDRVRIHSPRGELVVEAEPDETIHQSIVVLNASISTEDGDDPGVLIDASTHATDIHLESI